MITQWLVMPMTYQCLLRGNGNNSHGCGGTAHSHRLPDPCLLFPFMQSLWPMSVIPKRLSLVMIITTFTKKQWIDNYCMIIH